MNGSRPRSKELLQLYTGQPIHFAVHESVRGRDGFLDEIETNGGRVLSTLQDVDFCLLSSKHSSSFQIATYVVSQAGIPVDDAWIRDSIKEKRLLPWYEYRLDEVKREEGEDSESTDLRELIKCLARHMVLVRDEEVVYNHLSLKYPHRLPSEFQTLHKAHQATVEKWIKTLEKQHDSLGPPIGYLDCGRFKTGFELAKNENAFELPKRENTERVKGRHRRMVVSGKNSGSVQPRSVDASTSTGQEAATTTTVNTPTTAPSNATKSKALTISIPPRRGNPSSVPKNPVPTLPATPQSAEDTHLQPPLPRSTNFTDGTLTEIDTSAREGGVESKDDTEYTGPDLEEDEEEPPTPDDGDDGDYAQPEPVDDDSGKRGRKRKRSELSDGEDVSGVGSRFGLNHGNRRGVPITEEDVACMLEWFAEYSKGMSLNHFWIKFTNEAPVGHRRSAPAWQQLWRRYIDGHRIAKPVEGGDASQVASSILKRRRSEASGRGDATFSEQTAGPNEEAGEEAEVEDGKRKRKGGTRTLFTEEDARIMMEWHDLYAADLSQARFWTKFATESPIGHRRSADAWHQMWNKYVERKAGTRPPKDPRMVELRSVIGAKRASFGSGIVNDEDGDYVDEEEE